MDEVDDIFLNTTVLGSHVVNRWDRKSILFLLTQYRMKFLDFLAKHNKFKALKMMDIPVMDYVSKFFSFFT